MIKLPFRAPCLLRPFTADERSGALKLWNVWEGQANVQLGRRGCQHARQLSGISAGFGWLVDVQEGLR